MEEEEVDLKKENGSIIVYYNKKVLKIGLKYSCLPPLAKRNSKS
jgi:hypothetical protein